MKKRVLALFLAQVLLLSTGCSANVSVDPETGVVAVDGVPVNELISDLNTGNDESADEEADKDENDKEEQQNTSGEEKDDEVLEYEGGIRIILPDEFRDLTGIFGGNSWELGHNSGIYVTVFNYRGVTPEWLREVNAKKQVSDEEVEKYYNSIVPLAEIFTINGDRSIDDLVEFLKDDYEEDVSEDDLDKITKVGGTAFYLMMSDDTDNVKNLEDDFAKEYRIIAEGINDLITNAEFFEPVNPYEEMVGKKIEFKTKDIDGNEISSDEIFSQHEITMVNVWATWCGPCVNELAELEEINERLNKKDCAIIGIIGDGMDEGTIETGKQLLKENGDIYLNILPWEDALDKDLPILSGWPTSFFIDREGKMVSVPVVGAYVDGYEKIIDQLLKGKEPEIKPEASSPVSENDVKLYRVYVSDADGELVEGAMIEFCDDDTCRVENTDASGLAAFKVDEAEYKVHVLKAPKGYKKDTTEYEMPDQYSDLHIVLEKE